METSDFSSFIYTESKIILKIIDDKLFITNDLSYIKSLIYESEKSVKIKCQINSLPSMKKNFNIKKIKTFF